MRRRITTLLIFIYAAVFLPAAPLFADEAASTTVIAKTLSAPARPAPIAKKTSVAKKPIPGRKPTVQEQLLKQVDSGWSLNVSASRNDSSGHSSSLHQKLSAAKIENVSVMRTPLSQALESLVSEAPKGLALNFVVNSATDPEVTLNLSNTTFAEALDLLVEAAGMTYELRGNTIVVLPAGTVGALKTRYFPVSQSLIMRLIGAEIVKAPPPQQNSNNNKTEEPPPAVYQHGAAENAIKSFFERLGIVWPEGTGMVLADGELIVTHNTRTLDRIEEIVDRLAKHRQVEIEARFLEVSEGALNQLGAQWNIASANGVNQVGTTGINPNTSNTLRTLAGAFGSTTTTASGATAPTIPGGVNLAASTTNNAQLSGIVDSVKLSTIISAISQEDGTEMLSAPRLTVLSGSTASITVAQEMRYPQSYDRVNTDVGTGTTSGSVLTAPTPLDFTTRNVGVQMQVTPYVEDDGSITLILQPEVTDFVSFVDYGGQSLVINNGASQLVPSGFFQPVFNVRRLTTEVNIPSGATVLMGGLTREEKVKINDKVPLLGDLPLLGKAFRSSGSSTLKKNLVVFVTARLVE